MQVSFTNDLEGRTERTLTKVKNEPKLGEELDGFKEKDTI